MIEEGREGQKSLKLNDIISDPLLKKEKWEKTNFENIYFIKIVLVKYTF